MKKVLFAFICSIALLATVCFQEYRYFVNTDNQALGHITQSLSAKNIADDVRGDDDHGLSYILPADFEPWGPSIQGTLIWPLEAGEGFDGFEFAYVSNFVDIDSLNSTGGNVLDYNCGCRSYDTDRPTDDGTDTLGYDHDGIDISTYPYPYFKMANNLVNVVAVAEGVIIGKNDGNPDTNCRWGTGRPSNNLTLRHCDGTTSAYIHLKMNSLTSKGMNDTIRQGEYIGQIGSSGNSTNPHLHLELRDMNGILIDPFFGPCSNLNTVGNITTQTWWANQLPYFDANLMTLLTHAGVPTQPSCDLTDSTAVAGMRREKIVFVPGDSIVFAAYFSLVDNTKNCTARVLRPDNTEFTTMNYTFSASNGDPNCPNNYTKRTWYWNAFQLANNEQTGTWRYECTFDGQTYTRYFFVEPCPSDHNLSGTVDDIYFRRASNSITSVQEIENIGATNAQYHAGRRIDLEVGFTAHAGGRFRARITGCATEPDGF